MKKRFIILSSVLISLFSQAQTITRNWQGNGYSEGGLKGSGLLEWLLKHCRKWAIGSIKI